MKGIFRNFFVITLLFLMPFPIFADDISNSENKEVMNIYFCTKDLDLLASSFVASEKAGATPSSIIVSKSLNNKDHTFLRHCFMLLAYEKSINAINEVCGYTDFTTQYPIGFDVYGLNKGTLINEAGIRSGIKKMCDTKNFITLEPSSSYGYGVSLYGDDVLTEESWLSNDKELNKLTVSCVPVMKEIDVKNRRALMEEWHKLKSRMKNIADEKKYSVLNHNCCSVAYNSIRNNTKFDSSAINKRDFNLCGMGIEFSKKDDGVLDYVSGLINSGSDSSSGILRLIAKKMLLE